MFGFLATSFSSNSAEASDLKDPAISRTNLSKCIFCRVSSENGFIVVWENDEFVAFQDYRPAARHHYQVTPKFHIASVKDLRKHDAALVRSMKDIGNKLLDDLDVPPVMRRLGFHIPPYNSVDHLHLHVLGLPYKSIARSMKYPIRRGWGTYSKGFSWFAEVDQTIRILENDGRVAVLPC